MWTFPTTSVNQCSDPITFGMCPWYLDENVDPQRSRAALQSQSPIAAFKACNVIQSIGIAHSKIVLPSGDSKGESKNRTYCPTTWNYSYQWQYASEYADLLRKGSGASSPSMQGVHTPGAHPVEQEECQPSKLCICRFHEYSYVWCNGKLDAMYCFEG